MEILGDREGEAHLKGSKPPPPFFFFFTKCCLSSLWGLKECEAWSFEVEKSEGEEEKEENKEWWTEIWM